MDTGREPSEESRRRRRSMLDDLIAARDGMEAAAATGPPDDPPPRQAGERETGHGLRTSCLAVLAGVVLIVAGLWLGSWSYDQRFIYDSTARIWDVVSWAGFLLVLVGALTVPVAIVAFVTVAIVRLVRAARGR